MIVCNPLRNSLLLVGAQRGEMLIFVFLDTNYLVLIGFGRALCGTIYASVGEKKKEMSILYALTCVYHHLLPLLRTSGMRPTDLLCLACEFRVAMNEQSDMITGCKFQYLH